MASDHYTTIDRIAGHRKLDQCHGDLYAGGLRKRESRASHRKRTRTELLPQHGQQSIQPTERMKVEDGFSI